MIVTRKEMLAGGPRATGGPGWRSTRMLVRDDGVGFSLNDTEVAAGAVMTLEYRHHVEANYVVAGTGSVEDLATGEVHPLGPGTMYCLDRHDRHVLRVDADAPMRIVAVFSPALRGDEVHDGSGGYGA